MNLTISLEFRFGRTPDGAIWAPGIYGRSFWDRYLEVFDQVQVIARVKDLAVAPPEWKRADDGSLVTFSALPDYQGPLQYLFRFWQVHSTARQAIHQAEAVILRIGSQIASSLEPLLFQKHHPFGVEVVGDPYDFFAPSGIQHPLRPFFRWWFTQQMKQQCEHAAAATYVTKTHLQARYPTGTGSLSLACSDVELPASRFASQEVLKSRLASIEINHWNLQNQAVCPQQIVMVGAFEQLYKAPDVLIEAVGQCVRDGLNLHLVLVGEGKFRKVLEEKVAELGLGGQVHFRGHLAQPELVVSELDQADLFVLPSRSEGLPRAMVEAMARALPCIGSTVGGIPELLPAEDLVPPGDAHALAHKIKEVFTNPNRMHRMALRNLEKAGEFSEEKLQTQRRQFYQYLKERTQGWLNGFHYGEQYEHTPACKNTHRGHLGTASNA